MKQAYPLTWLGLTVLFSKSMSLAAITYWCEVHRFRLTNIREWSRLNWVGTGHYY